MSELFNIIMNDGSRHFGDIPARVNWYELRDYIKQLEGTTITGFITDGVTEAWIDFSYRGNKFSVNDQFGDYWFFVDDENCSDEILIEVLDHCRKVFDSGDRSAES